MIILDSLTKSFGPRTVLDGLSIEIPDGRNRRAVAIRALPELLAHAVDPELRPVGAGQRHDARSEPIADQEIVPPVLVDVAERRHGLVENEDVGALDQASGEADGAALRREQQAVSGAATSTPSLVGFGRRSPADYPACR
jgi:hypothetical protein